MKLYGYKKRILNEDGLLSLSEVTIRTNPSNLRRIAAFILAAADEMEKMKKQFDHKHFKDTQAKKNKDHPDIVIVR